MEKQIEKIPTIFTTGIFLFITYLVLMISLLQNFVSLSYLAFFLLAMIHGSYLVSRFSPYGLSFEACLDKTKVFPDTPVTLQVTVKNKKILPVRILLSIPWLPLFFPFKETFTGEAILLSFEERIWEWHLVLDKRGCYPLHPLFMRSGDLPGLYSRQVNWGGRKMELLVYPRLRPMEDLLLIPFLLGNQEVESLSKDYSLPIGTREYHGTRPARYINWKATARHNKLQENIPTPVGSIQVLLLLNVKGYPDEKSFEEQLEQVASLAALLDEKGYPVGLITNSSLKGSQGEFIPPLEGESQLQIILETLARVQRRGEKDLCKILKESPFIRKDTYLILFQGREREALFEEFLEENGLGLCYTFTVETQMEERDSSFSMEPDN